MKILILSVFFPQENTIASLRVYSWAKYWSKMGHDVTVITTTKEKTEVDLNFDLSGFKLHEVMLPKFLENIIFPTKAESNLRQSLNNHKSNNLKTCVKKIFFQPFKTILNIFRKSGAFSTLRMPDKFDFWYFPALRLARKEKWDLVISSYGPYVSHLVAYKLKKLKLTKTWIADYRDLWTMNQAFTKGVFPFNILEEYLEKKINLTADVITSVSEPLTEKLKSKYGIESVYTIENGFDFDDIKHMNISQYWNDNKIRIVYTGSIYEGKQDPEPIFKAISAINKSAHKDLLNNFQLVFVGKNQLNIEKLVKHYNIEMFVVFEGFVSRDDVLRMQRDANALLYLEFNHCEGILSGKIFEYLASKTFILSVGGINEKSYVSNFIKNSNCGKVLGNDVNQIKAELLFLINTPSKIITDNSFAFNYDRKNLAERMLNLVRI